MQVASFDRLFVSAQERFATTLALLLVTRENQRESPAVLPGFKNSIYSVTMLDSKKIFSSLLLALVLLFMPGRDCRSVAKASSTEKAVEVRATWSVTATHPGDQAILAVVLQVKKGFHINADERQIIPVEDLKLFPTKVTVTGAGKGLKIEAPIYPAAVSLKVPYLADQVMSFQGETVVYLPVRLEETTPAGEQAGLSLQVQYQPCSEEYCLLPEKRDIETSISVVTADTVVEKINQELFAGYEPGLVPEVSEEISFGMFGWDFSVDSSSFGGVVLLLIIAAFGGMLLNFTPACSP